MHALEIAALAVALFGVGDLCMRRISDVDAKSRVPVAIGAGYGIIGQLIFLLGSAGRFDRLSVGVLCAAAAVASVPALGRLVAAVRSVAPSTAAILVAGLIPPFVLGLYPPSGFDATMYHLPFARLFVETGRLAVAETLRFPVFPQLGEVFFGASMLLADDITAQLTQWLALAVTAGALMAIAVELGRPRAGRVALALWLGVPLVLYLGANAYIDSTLAMCVTLAFYSWLVWQRTSRISWLAFCAMFCGMAAGTKYHGLFFVVALLASLPFTAPKGSRVRSLAAAALAVAIFAGPWYVRIARETGNPVFPYLSRLFGHSEFRTVTDTRINALLDAPLETLGSAGALAGDAARLFSRIEAPTSPWLVLLLPLTIAAAVLEPRVRPLLIAGACYVAIVTPLAQARYVVPVLPLIAASIGWVAERAWTALFPSSRSSAAAIALALLMLPGIGWMAILARRYGPIPSDGVARDRFLSRRIAIYDALRFVDRTIPARARQTIYIVGAPEAFYYCNGRCMGDWFGPYGLRQVLPLLREPADLAATLRRFGVQVLVTNRRAFDTPALRGSPSFHLVYETPAADVFLVRSPDGM